MSPADKKSRLLELPGIAADAVERHVRRMDADYWNDFSAEEIARHIETLEGLESGSPRNVRVERLDEGLSGLTLIGGDFQGFFAAVSGFLASEGYDIRTGRVFSFGKDGAPKALPRGGILDFLVLRHDDPARDSEAERERLRAEMEDLLRRFERGDNAAIRVELYRRIGKRLEARNNLAGDPVPLEIQIHAVNNATRLVIRARDREGMLFCIAGALSLQGLSLVSLLTDAGDDGFFENSLLVAGPGGQPVRDARELEKIRTGIALMERLLQTLPAAVDLQAAAEGLQGLVEDWLEESSDWTARENLNVLPALSRVLTSGPWLWDAVDRIGPRAFRLLLTELAREITPPDRDAHAQALREIDSGDREQCAKALRAWRDREVLKAELDLLLTPARDWRGFSERLAGIAEASLSFLIDRLRADLESRHGKAAPFALFALGKFGGEELGSGSDLEIVIVHGGGGDTGGEDPLRQGDFYERLCRELIRTWSVPEGETFALDLRLRPHGESGPLASSREAWVNYYRPGGSALDYERQSLLRMRLVHGDAELGRQLLDERDHITYSDPPLPIAATLDLFAKQSARKKKQGLWNAKYSPGGLAELEYGVQFLQLRHGARKPQVRQHQWARALEALLETGILSLAEFENLYSANLLLRRLINALRRVRGQARDLDCPPAGTPEFSFLAKRLDYAARPGLDGETRLERDLKRAQNVVESFFRHRFLDGPRPDWLYESVAEPLMDHAATVEEASPALTRLGMTDLPAAKRMFHELFDTLVEKRLAAACLLNAEGHFRRSPDPEGVLRHLVRYLQGLPHPDVFIRQALHHPPLLEKLLLVFANSDPLSDLAVREGDGFKDLIEPESLEKPRLREEFARLAADAAANADLGADVETRLCRLRNREYLRIALRDLHLSVPLREITFEISGLSDALMEAGLREALDRQGQGHLEERMAVLALGKLGGSELNYSSDIDLVFVLEDAAAHAGMREVAERAGREFIKLLTRDTSEGRLFRVDMKLRPWGGQGPLVGSVSQYAEYFKTEADGWELQAWLKARTVCGAEEGGDTVIAAAQERACAPENAAKVVDSMCKVRLQGLDALKQNTARDLIAGEVKLGPGGIRTVEFFTQSLQIRHAREFPQLLTGNTLEALGRLNRYGILPGGRYQLLTESYVFLRRVEHRLQLQGLQQRHAMPTDAVGLNRLARQMGFEDRVGRPARDQFLDQYRKHMLSLQPVSAELFGH